MEVTLKGHLTHALHIAKIISRALKNKMCAIFFIISRKLNSTPIFGNALWWLTGFLEFPKTMERDLNQPLAKSQMKPHPLVDGVTWEGITQPFENLKPKPETPHPSVDYWTSIECYSHGLPLASLTLICKRGCGWVELFTGYPGNKPQHIYSFLAWEVFIPGLKENRNGHSSSYFYRTNFHSH